MEQFAVTNGNQRQPAIVVARAAGITTSQYARLRHAATSHLVTALGPTPLTRFDAFRQLVRQGVITSATVERHIAEYQAHPVDAADPVEQVREQLSYTVRDAAELLCRVNELSRPQCDAIETANALLDRVVMELDGDDDE